MDRTNKIVSAIFYAAIQSVSPYEATKQSCNHIITEDTLGMGNARIIKVIGFGKAACPMAKAVEEWLRDTIDLGVIITKYSHCREHVFSKITVHEAGHPLPDANGLKGTEHVIDVIRETDEHTLIFCLISGGGSALLVSPYDGITLDEKQKVTDLLLRSGADIQELNIVRKHLSKVKGGRLAEIAYPAKIISLILSDVIQDRIDTIASGPTAPDVSVYDDALFVLKKYGLMGKIPDNVLHFLQIGSEGIIPETPKEGDVIFRNVQNIIIGSNAIALHAAQDKAQSLGFNSEIISEKVIGEARDIGIWLASVALEAQKNIGIHNQKGICLISGGETTVTVKGSGLGGRNMELALSFAMQIEGIHGITLLSAGTDGTDGPTDAAGAIVDGNTIGKAKRCGFDPHKFLDNNDSYNFFKKTDGLFVTGPTGTNVMDIQIIIIE
ncbi:MAG TPA: glycerate kinase [Thermodesulfovibrionales bacterium]|nr:glycerate kinase [Thermodesulfovibrionales bacterium]